MPIILAGADLDIYKEIGRAIARAIKELKREAVIIASGDMTHYEPQAAAKEKDMKAIEAMLDLDEDELTRRYEEPRYYHVRLWPGGHALSPPLKSWALPGRSW